MTTNREELSVLAARVEALETMVDFLIRATDSLIAWALNGQVWPDGFSVDDIRGPLALISSSIPAEESDNGE